MNLLTRLRAVTGWPVTRTAAGWVLEPPTGGEAVIGTDAAAAAWLERAWKTEDEATEDEPEWQQSELWAA